MSDRGPELLQAYFDGRLAPEEAAEFNDWLRRPGNMDEFVRQLDLHSALGDALGTPVHTRRSLRRWIPSGSWAAAALAILVAGALVLTLFSGSTLEVAQGQVVVAGQSTTSLREGQEFAVPAGSPAVIAMRDGSRAEFAPASEALIRRGGVVSLRKGRVRGAARVETPAGSVAGSGAEYTVELKGDGSMNTLAMALFVAVHAGTASVDSVSGPLALAAGESRLFAAGELLFAQEREGERPKQEGERKEGERKETERRPPPRRDGEKEGERPVKRDGEKEGERPVKREGDGERPPVKREGDGERKPPVRREGEGERERPKDPPPRPNPERERNEGRREAERPIPVDERVVPKEEKQPDLVGRIVSIFRDGETTLVTLRVPGTGEAKPVETVVYLVENTPQTYYGGGRKREGGTLRVGYVTYVWLKRDSKENADNVRIIVPVDGDPR